jgi:hypothetical protein
VQSALSDVDNADIAEALRLYGDGGHNLISRVALIVRRLALAPPQEGVAEIVADMREEIARTAADPDHTSAAVAQTLQHYVERLTTPPAAAPVQGVEGDAPTCDYCGQSAARILKAELAQRKAESALAAAQPGGGFVVVDRGALQTAINMLRRDAAEGKAARGELADLLEGPTPAAPKQSQEGG